MDVLGFDWSDLVFFLELARHGRLVPAAKRLRADHTTVSRRIAELERALHCKLFDRNPNGFILTDAGQKLFTYAEAIESKALAIAENVGGIATEPSGRVRVATMEGIGSFYLAPRFAKLRESFPEIRVRASYGAPPHQSDEARSRYLAELFPTIGSETGIRKNWYLPAQTLCISTLHSAPWLTVFCSRIGSARLRRLRRRLRCDPRSEVVA